MLSKIERTIGVTEGLTVNSGQRADGTGNISVALRSLTSKTHALSNYLIQMVLNAVSSQ
jgi:hypothetical protein